MPLEIVNNGNDDTAIGFRNKGVNLGNINFGVDRFQIFSNNMGGIIGKQILVISSAARDIYDYKSKSLKEILVQGDTTHFQSGEVFQVNDTVSFSGYITDASRAIVVTFVLPKSANDMSVNVECSNLKVRGNKTYLINNGNLSEYDFKILQIYENIVTAHIKNKDVSVLSDENNIALSICGGFKFTFS